MKIQSFEYRKGNKKGKKLVDHGLEELTKEDMRIIKSYEKRKKAGKEVAFSFEPISLMGKLALHVDKDRRGNVTVFVRQPKKGECHNHKCYNKVVKDYVLCRKHLGKRK